jgi:5-(carboxyamino)imidazole ribonucleotide synthase
MVNFIGGLADDQQILALDNTHLHLYDKTPRKGRKVAHATVRTDEVNLFRQSLTTLATLADQVDDS